MIVVGSGREKSSIRKQQIIRMVKMPIMVANVGVSIFWMMRDIILNIFEVLVWMYFLKCGFVSNSVAKVCIVSGRGWWLCGERVFGCCVWCWWVWVRCFYRVFCSRCWEGHGGRFHLRYRRCQ